MSEYDFECELAKIKQAIRSLNKLNVAQRAQLRSVERCIELTVRPVSVSDVAEQIAPYREIPAPFCELHRLAHRCPAAPGVYFVWGRESGLRPAYVGSSLKMLNRLTGQHPHIRLGDRFSWLQYESPDHFFAEMFYIATSRPPRNWRPRSFSCAPTLQPLESTR